AFIGAVAALWIADQPFSVASLVGFISLCGIASRNGVLMISHYIHLMAEEGMEFGKEMVIRGSLERVAPVLMTALTTGLGLIPLAMAAGQPGKELLFPVAIVVIGGLLTSTVLDFFVRPTLFLHYAGNASRRTLERMRAGTDSLSAEVTTSGVDIPAVAFESRETIEETSTDQDQTIAPEDPVAASKPDQEESSQGTQHRPSRSEDGDADHEVEPDADVETTDDGNNPQSPPEQKGNES
ncbi:MAG: efflux RND transporter permease subunit, partial [Planctomycetota bacterium]|nr:efflux RND transporter permease subunit [Planctomycetota bacterium]